MSHRGKLNKEEQLQFDILDLMESVRKYRIYQRNQDHWIVTEPPKERFTWSEGFDPNETVTYHEFPSEELAVFFVKSTVADKIIERVRKQ